jgi:bacterioferritin-associated ferredoxin
MIVCSCNLIRETDIRAAARFGARCPRTAYARLGAEPECCGCLDHAAEIIDEECAQLLRMDRKSAA